MAPAPARVPERSSLSTNGPVLMLAASFCFALMGVCVKYVVTPPDGAFAAIPIGEVVLFRSVVAAVIAVAVGLQAGKSLAGVSRKMLVTRGLVGLASMYCYFFAISQLKLGDAVLLTYLSPLIVAAMAPFVLGEHASWTVLIALGIGFAGVYAVEDPSGEIAGPGVVAGLASAVLAAGAYVSVKVLSRTDSTAAIVLWFSVVASLVSGVQVVVQGSWVTPGWRALGGLTAVGLCAAFAQLLMTKAYAVSDAARVSVFAYATPVLAYVLGRALLAEAIGVRGAVGCSLLALAGLLATYSRRPSSS